MRKLILGLMAAALLLPGQKIVGELHSGQLLRLHVVAQDDTREMQAVKLTVRDAVQAIYAQRCPRDGRPMLAAAQELLPEMTRAAREAAGKAGFEGEVRVTLGTERFDTRLLAGCVIPAGNYPALMVRLGDAAGHNWWGLLDPELSLEAAAVSGTSGPVEWDWSLGALWEALRSWWGGVADA